MTEAATFLDGVALELDSPAEVRNVPHQLSLSCRATCPQRARPSPAMAEVRRFFEERVAHWDDAEKEAKPRWDAEVVSTAAALAMNDAATAGKLHPRTREALDRVWTVQKPDGGFDWLKCDWPPLEYDDYYGAIVAALWASVTRRRVTLNHPAAQAGLKRLRAYFSKNRPRVCIIKRC